MEVASRCEDGYCTQKILQVMNCFDITLWVHLGCQNQGLQSEENAPRETERRGRMKKTGITGVNKEKRER